MNNINSIPSLSNFWKQFFCDHEWKYNAYFDEIKERGSRFMVIERTKIICKKCHKIKVRTYEEYEAKEKKLSSKLISKYSTESTT